MRRWMLLCVVLMAGCSKGPQADLPYISQARSLAAEWALVNQQASEGKLANAYVMSMRKSLRQQLETTSKSLTQTDSDYAREIEAAAHEPDNAPPGELRAHSDKLKKIEDSLESA